MKRTSDGSSHLKHQVSGGPQALETTRQDTCDVYGRTRKSHAAVVSGRTVVGRSPSDSANLGRTGAIRAPSDSVTGQRIGQFRPDRTRAPSDGGTGQRDGQAEFVRAPTLTSHTFCTSYGNSLSDPLSDPDFIDNPPMIQPKFTSRSQSIRAVIGDTITLPCEVDNLGNNILLWRRGSAVVTASNLIITRDLRFKLLKGYTLQIKNVRPQDAGDYSCQVGDHDNRDLVHTVEILVPPSVRSVPETGHVTVRKGGTATLECKASGNPVPSISWSRKDSLHGAPHLAEGPTLTLESVSRQDSGTYRCFADNGIREPVFVDLQLIVLSPPEITVEKTWVHAGEGYETQLVCTVHGDSTPEMMWYQDSFLLHPNDRRTMDSRGDKHYLTIRNVRQSDFGNYSCVAENTLGRAKKYIEMSGRPGPAQFHSPMYSRYREMYNLTWSVESFPPIEEIRLLYRKLMMNESYQHPGRWHDVILNPPSTRAESYRHIMTYTIRSLDPNSVYETIVQAKNRYGWNEVSDIFQFYTLSSDMPEEDVEQTLGSTAFGNPFGWANGSQSSCCTSWLIVLGISLLLRIFRSL